MVNFYLAFKDENVEHEAQHPLLETPRVMAQQQLQEHSKLYL